MTIPHDSSKIWLRDEVEKVSGYKYPGVVVGIVHKLDGQVRFVVECTAEECAGMLHIFRPEQLRRAE